VLVRPRDPGNIGASVRAAANFGFRDVAVVEPHSPVWREASSAVGVEELLGSSEPFTLEGALRESSLILGTHDGRRPVGRPLVPLPRLGEFLGGRLAPGGRLAVLFGSEKTGLTKEQLSHCHAVVRIPTVPELPSMNLGQSVALVAYELARLRPAEPVRRPALEAVTAEQSEALLREFLSALDALGYMSGLAAQVKTRRVRDALKRLDPCRKDAGLLLGVLRRIGR
jgi:tRNA/rRNA methyltransferase